MCSSRSVGARSTPTASTMCCPCAQHSIRRAVRNDLAPIDGPYQITRASSLRVVAASASCPRLVLHTSRSSAGSIDRNAPSVTSSIASGVASGASAGPRPSSDARKRSSSAMAHAAVWSKYARCPIWSATDHLGLGVGRAHCSAVSRETIASSSACSSRRSLRMLDAVDRVVVMSATVGAAADFERTDRVDHGRSGVRELPSAP